jgi:hypothetical protein
MSKNCSTCKWEPDWKEKYYKVWDGVCRFPLELKIKPACLSVYQIEKELTGRKFEIRIGYNKVTSCDAWQAKEDHK